jgi:hypothetical protein
MRVLNSNFNFTVKVGKEHFGGQFNYHQNGAEVVKMSFRRFPAKKTQGFIYEQVNYLRNIDGRWTLWDMNRKAPKYHNDEDQAVYAVFREAYGLSLLDEVR